MNKHTGCLNGHAFGKVEPLEESDILTINRKKLTSMLRWSSSGDPR